MSPEEEMLEICLEEVEREGLAIEECLSRHGDAARGLAPLLQVAERYRQAPPARPSAAFQEAARARMLRLTAATPAPAPPTRLLGLLLPPWGGARTAALLRVAAALLLLSMVAGTTVAAAMASAPDSPLYPAKLAVEEVRLRLATGGAERSELHLGMAERRVSELEAIAGRVSPADVVRLVVRLEGAVRDAVREAEASGRGDSLLPLLLARLAQQERRLEELSARLDPTAAEDRASLERASRFLVRERLELTERSREGGQPSDDPADAPVPAERGGSGAAAQVTPSAAVTLPPRQEGPPAEAAGGETIPSPEAAQRAASPAAPEGTAVATDASMSPLEDGGSDEGPGDEAPPAVAQPELPGSTATTQPGGRAPAATTSSSDAAEPTARPSAAAATPSGAPGSGPGAAPAVQAAATPVAAAPTPTPKPAVSPVPTSPPSTGGSGGGGSTPPPSRSGGGGSTPPPSGSGGSGRR
ncbi:MAG: DUF5667 domain-containing protein [Chloroflexota bacterium]